MTNKEYLLKLYKDSTEILATDLMDLDPDGETYWHFTIGEDEMVRSNSYAEALSAQ